MAIGQRLMWAVVGTAAATLTRRVTRRVLHKRNGALRLPRRVRSKTGLNTALAWAAGTGALLGVADVLSEQGKNAAREG